MNYKTTKNVELDEDGIPQPSVYYSMSSRSRISNEYHVYILGSIKEPEHYAELLGTLMQTDDNDVVFIHLNSPGGSYYCCLQLQNAIRMCSALTVAVIHGQCSSAASALALTCDEVEVMPMAEMLAHNASYGFGGRANDNLEHAQFSSKQLRKWLDTTYEGFLTEEEIIAVEKGRQHMMDAEEIIERLQQREEYFKAMREDEQRKIAEEEAPKSTRGRKKTVASEA